jgi:hypothetical protein
MDSHHQSLCDCECVLDRSIGCDVDRIIWETVHLRWLSSASILYDQTLIQADEGGDWCELTHNPSVSAPLYDDGAVRYVNRLFKPQKIFQSEPSDKVEAAWEETMGSQWAAFFPFRHIQQNQASAHELTQPSSPGNGAASAGYSIKTPRNSGGR